MVETITPVVHGGRNRRYWASVLLHVLGATVTAALFGALLGGLGFGLATGVTETGLRWNVLAPWLLVAVAAMYAARELLGLPIPVPDRHKQVPEWWRTFYSPPVAATLYGVGLGVGFFTFLTYATFVVVSVGALALADPLRGAVIVAPFGLARGLSVVLASGALDEEAAAQVVDRVEEVGQGRAPRLINGVTMAAVAVTTALVTL
jgi:hypothetical protein